MNKMFIQKWIGRSLTVTPICLFGVIILFIGFSNSLLIHHSAIIFFTGVIFLFPILPLILGYLSAKIDKKEEEYME
jgi:hypothetical protein